MGNDCCKKKKLSKNNILNELKKDNNEKYDKKDNDSNEQYSEKNYNEKYKNDILNIKDNKGKKNFEDNEDEESNNNENKNGYLFNDNENNDADSKTKFKKGNKNIIKEEQIPKKKNFFSNLFGKKNKNNTYEKILLDYLLLHERLKNESDISVYIINKKDNEGIIKLYNKVIKSEEYKIDIQKEEKEQIIKDIISNELNYNLEEINNKIKIYNYEDCLNLKNQSIDIIDSSFCKNMKLKDNKKAQALYINMDINSENKTIEFNNKKRIRIEKRNEEFYIREFLDGDYSINEKNSKKNKNIENIIEVKDIENKDENFSFETIENNNNNINEKNILIISNRNNNNNNENNNIKNSFTDDESKKIENKNSIDNKINNSECINVGLIQSVNIKEKEQENLEHILFKILILYNVQNEKILLNEDLIYHDFNSNNIYYLINKNIIISLRNLIFEKSEDIKNIENLNKLINEFIEKRGYENFKLFFNGIDKIIEIFKQQIVIYLILNIILIQLIMMNFVLLIMKL